jgi:PAS domain-containing protein
VSNKGVHQDDREIQRNRDANLTVGATQAQAAEFAALSGHKTGPVEFGYQRLFEAARDGILILDVATGRVTDANPFLIELLGFSKDEMVGKTVGDLTRITHKMEVHP